MKYTSCLVLALSMYFSACTKKVTKPKDELSVVLDKVFDETSKIGQKEANQLETLITRFQNEKDEFKKFKLCLEINLGNLNKYFSSNWPGRPKDVDANRYDREIGLAAEYCKVSMARIARFEESITTDEWAKISGDLKRSYLIKTKKILAKPADCNRADIQKAVDSGEKVYQDFGTIVSLMVVIEAKEQLNFDYYLPRYRALIESKPGPEQNFILSSFNYFKDRFDENRSSEMLLKNLDKHTQLLRKNGITDINDVAHKALSLASNCFSGVSVTTMKHARDVLNQRMMTLWQAFFSKKKTAVDSYLEPSRQMSGWLEINYDRREELEQAGLDRRDPHGSSYYFRIQKKGVQVFSIGEDREANTEDDLII